MYSEPNLNFPCGLAVLCAHLEETCLPQLILLSKSSQSQGNRNGGSLGPVSGQSGDKSGHFIVTASALIPAP